MTQVKTNNKTELALFSAFLCTALGAGLYFMGLASTITAVF